MSDTVLIGGVFDPLHFGHMDYINEAKKHGHVICVVSDAPEKHPPVVPLIERTFMLGCLVTQATCCLSIPEALQYYRPNKYIKGKDWEGRLPPEEVAICKQLGIEIVYTDTSRQSSSQLLADYERRRNTEKLAAFESWVRTQQPAEKPWTPVTDYSWEARKEAEGPHAKLIAEAFESLTVLDVGCGHGHLVRMLRELGMSAEGMDAQKLAPFPVYVADITHEALVRNFSGLAFPEVIVCREVLEHMIAQDVALAVKNMVRIAKRFIYVTTRFTSKPHLLDFDLADGLDPTHITMLNQDLLRTLFVLEGCTRRPDLEAKLDHQKKGRVLVYEVPA